VQAPSQESQIGRPVRRQRIRTCWHVILKPFHRPRVLLSRSQPCHPVLKPCHLVLMPCHPSSSLVIPTPKAEESLSHDSCAHLVTDACPRLRQLLISGGSVEFAMDGKGRSCPAPFPAFRTAGNHPPARRAFALQPLAFNALLSVLAVCAGDSGQ